MNIIHAKITMLDVACFSSILGHSIIETTLTAEEDLQWLWNF